jgi:TPP-dependent indolepyruvate ferredoxin oxidoreductase alpha subunit
MTPKSSWQDAHLRMLETLPKRTHRAQELGDLNWRHWRRKGKQAVVINGVQYASLTSAAKSLGTNRPAILKMVERGEASIEPGQWTLK